MSAKPAPPRRHRRQRTSTWMRSTMPRRAACSRARCRRLGRHPHHRRGTGLPRNPWSLSGTARRRPRSKAIWPTAIPYLHCPGHSQHGPSCASSRNTWDLRYSRTCACRCWKGRGTCAAGRPERTSTRTSSRACAPADPKAARGAMQTQPGGGPDRKPALTAELEAMEQTRERLAAKREEIALRAASAAR